MSDQPWTDDTVTIGAKALAESIYSDVVPIEYAQGVVEAVLASLHEAGLLVPPGAFLARQIDEKAEDDGISW